MTKKTETTTTTKKEANKDKKKDPQRPKPLTPKAGIKPGKRY